jgi:hypothetical protein
MKINFLMLFITSNKKYYKQIFPKHKIVNLLIYLGCGVLRDQIISDYIHHRYEK